MPEYCLRHAEVITDQGDLAKIKEKKEPTTLFMPAWRKVHPNSHWLTKCPLDFYFNTVPERTRCEKVNISEGLCLWLWSPSQNAKCMELETANSNQKSKSWWHKRVLPARFTVWNRTMQISRQNADRNQIDVVSSFTRQMKPNRLENAPRSAASSDGPGFAIGLIVKTEGVAASKMMRLQMKPRSCKYLIFALK